MRTLARGSRRHRVRGHVGPRSRGRAARSRAARARCTISRARRSRVSPWTRSGVVYAAASQLDASTGRPAPVEPGLRPDAHADADALAGARRRLRAARCRWPLRRPRRGPPSEPRSTSSSEIVVDPARRLRRARLALSRGVDLRPASRPRAERSSSRRARAGASTSGRTATCGSSLRPVRSWRSRSPGRAPAFAVVTMGSAGILRPGPAGRAAAGTFTSAVKDGLRLSTFARLRSEGTVPAGAALALSVRTGNSDKPDAHVVGLDAGRRGRRARNRPSRASSSGRPT